jgi:hypothetical protein
LQERPIETFCAPVGLVWSNLSVVFYYPTNDPPQADNVRHIEQNKRISPINATRQYRFIQVITIRNPTIFSNDTSDSRRK